MEPQTLKDQAESGEFDARSKSDDSVETEEPQQNAKNTSGVSEHKLFAILGYIFPFLFFVPLLIDKTKHDKFARFHANQQLILLIASIAVHFVGGYLFMAFMSLGLLLMQLLNMALFVLGVFGIWYAYKSEMKNLPLIGSFRILK